jgi:glycine hydroxymethyltransferase
LYLVALATTTNPGSTTPDQQLDDAIARQFKPLILVAGYSAYPRRINFATMREIADEVGATLMVDMAHFAGLVAGKVFTGEEDPIPYAHVTTTTTHKSLRGPRGGLVLAQPEYAGAVDKGCPMVLGGPLPHVMAAKAVALAEARQPAFRVYAQRVTDNAKALAEGFLRRGARLVTGGTDNHIVMLDVTSFGLTGVRPSRRCWTPAWSPTATPSLQTPTAPGTPAASGSALPR